MANITLGSSNKTEYLTETENYNPLLFSWDSLPNNHRIVIKYNNGCYIGIERDESGEIHVFYSKKITRQNSGETSFESFTTEEEKNTIIIEN